MFRNSLHCLLHIIRTEGFLSMYKNFLPSVAKASPMIGLQYCLFFMLRESAGVDGLRRFGTSVREHDLWSGAVPVPPEEEQQPA